MTYNSTPSIRIPPWKHTTAINWPLLWLVTKAMVRSAAKNHADVIVITNPDQHRSVLEALSKTEGEPSGVDLRLRRDLAISAFQSPKDASFSLRLGSAATRVVMGVMLAGWFNDGAGASIGAAATD